MTCFLYGRANFDLDTFSFFVEDNVSLSDSVPPGTKEEIIPNVTEKLLKATPNVPMNPPPPYPPCNSN